MKTILTNKKLVLIMLGAFFLAKALAYTPMTSVNWADLTTCGCAALAALVCLNHINIPVGITVSPDKVVVFSGSIYSFTVNGSKCSNSCSRLLRRSAQSRILFIVNSLSNSNLTKGFRKNGNFIYA